MQTLDLNLARRPFRNNTLLWLGYGSAFTLLALFSFWTVNRYLDAKAEVSRIVDTEVNFDERMALLKQRNDRVLAAVRQMDLSALRLQSGKANEVLAWKSFSWTRLFNILEGIQPHDVRMTSIRPMFRTVSEDPGTASDAVRSVPVAIEGVAKTYRDVADFQLSLQEDPHFSRVEPLSMRRTDKREYKFQMRVRYAPEAQQAADEAAVADATEVAEAGEASAEAAPAVDPGQVQEVAGDGFAGDAEETRSEPAATDNIRNKIRRPPATDGENAQ